MEPLSPHSFRGGRYSSSPAFRHSSSSSARRVELAATPPAAHTRLLPWSLAAATTRGTTLWATVRDTAAARSARLTACPFCPALWIRFTAAVFRPEKEKS